MKIEKPRMNEFKIFHPPRPFKSRHRNIKSVKLVKIDIDEECEKDMENGKGFLITNEEPFDKKDNRTNDGLFSPLYGVDTFSDKTLDTAYRCECGGMIGGVNEGDICDDCGTEVKFCDSDLSITGYIPLGDYYIINPSCYLDLETLIGGKELEKILCFNNKFDVDGKMVRTVSKSSPYAGIGMMAFHEQFEEITEYYLNKRGRVEHYENLKRFKHAIFCKHVGAYSSLLRPLLKEDSRLGMLKVNKSYGIILANANIIRSEPYDKSKRIIVEKSLFEIQNEFNKIFKLLISTELSQKNGHIRGKITCARVDLKKSHLTGNGQLNNLSNCWKLSLSQQYQSVIIC